MTKEKFLSTYETEIKARYSWAADEERLRKFMQTARNTIMGINGRTSLWSAEGEAVTAAWKAIGGKGKPSLVHIRKLRTET